MNSTNYERAQTLVQALPYIQKFYGKTIVVKYGGNAMINNDLFAAVMEDIVLLNLVGVKVVLVHGGGPESNPALSTACATLPKRPCMWCRWCCAAR